MSVDSISTQHQDTSVDAVSASDESLGDTASLVDEIWGESSAPADIEREPAPISANTASERDDDANANDEEDDGELIPLGLVLREVELDVREARIAQSERVERFAQHIEGLIEDRTRAALVEALHGRRQPSSFYGGEEQHKQFRLIAWSTVEQMHGGGYRVWVPRGDDWRVGEWQDRLRQRCKRGCRWCPKRPQ